MYADPGEPSRQRTTRRHRAGTAGETQRHQGRPQHQACAMGSRHQKRPHEETGDPHLHAEAHAMTMAEAPVVKRPADQDERGADPERPSVHKPTHPQKDERNSRNRHRMTKGDRHEREPDDAAILAVKAERHGEQPPHTRVQPVKCAESGNREPWPELERSRYANHRFPSLKDNSRNPKSSRRPRAAPDGDDVASATARRTSDRRRCPRWDWHRASPSNHRYRRDRTEGRWRCRASW